MRNLIIIILLISTVFTVKAKSPHGENFKRNCAECHNTQSWKLKNDLDFFDHSKTKFPLVGQHKTVGCRKCHLTLVFSEAKTNCSSCHTDVHQNTVGRDCERCHTPNSWIINNVKQLHQQSGFPLVGAHASTDCNRCHVSASQLRFDNISADCYSCHREQYFVNANPVHKAIGFDRDCGRCHNMTGKDWSTTGKGFDHGFFPLTGGHNLDCAYCHIGGNYEVKLSTDCKTCHATALARAVTTLPAHTSKIASFECASCHSTQGWSSVRFKQHDGWFKIYSGKHKGVWSKCTDCHNNDATYKANCKKCHD